MPIGVICNVLAMAIGGLIGAAAKDHISNDFKEKLNMIFSICSMAIGIASIVLMENMPAVVFAVILGTSLGLLIHLGGHINRGAQSMQRLIARMMKNGPSTDESQAATLVTVIVLFCASGTGIYVAIVSGMSGDHSILIAKSILDLFTALIFACSLGAVVSLIALPQFVIFLALFFAARFIFPLTTPSMINDFKACGGILMVATGFRILGLTPFPTADMIPSMVLVMPMSWIWTNILLKLL